jgi:hypothetical protein
LPPDPGVIQVQFTPTAPAVPDFALQMGEMRVAHVIVLGDAPPPTGVTLPPDADLDLLGQPVQLTFSGFPNGVYSVVQLDFHAVMLAGTWRGTPVFMHIEPMRGTRVNVRSSVGKELTDGQTINFPVTVDVSSWLDGGLLDEAFALNGKIVCDDRNNPGVSSQLADRIAASFTLP